ncbi:MAG TPA: hypothetical protein VHX88_02420 [Solirubrobacteraceae bacterium]|nr:hypothetical protein [Solirubrobacteraceae bacterium]
MIRGSGLVGSGVVGIVQRFADESLPTIAQAPGFLGATVGQNLRRGSALSLAFFDSEESLREGERLYADAQRLREPEFGEENPYVSDSLNVVFATAIYTELGGTTAPLMYAARVTGLPAETVEAAVAGYRENVQRHFDDSRGAEGGLVATDPAAGTVVQLTFWSSDMDMRESLRAAPASPVAGASPDSDEFEIAIARNLDRLPRISG